MTWLSLLLLPIYLKYLQFTEGPPIYDVTHLGGGGSAKRLCYCIGLFSIMGNKGEGGIKNLKKWALSLILNASFISKGTVFELQKKLYSFYLFFFLFFKNEIFFSLMDDFSYLLICTFAKDINISSMCASAQSLVKDFLSSSPN